MTWTTEAKNSTSLDRLSVLDARWRWCMDLAAVLCLLPLASGLIGLVAR